MAGLMIERAALGGRDRAPKGQRLLWRSLKHLSHMADVKTANVNYTNSIFSFFVRTEKIFLVHFTCFVRFPSCWSLSGTHQEREKIVFRMGTGGLRVLIDQSEKSPFANIFFNHLVPGRDEFLVKFIKNRAINFIIMPRSVFQRLKWLNDQQQDDERSERDSWRNNE